MLKGLSLGRFKCRGHSGWRCPEGPYITYERMSGEQERKGSMSNAYYMLNRVRVCGNHVEMTMKYMDGP